MAEEFILTPADEYILTPAEQAKPVEQPKRVSAPLKQGIAGITDIGTGLPAILGFAGSGLEAGFNTLVGDKGFGENFEAAMKEGLDANLISAGIGARDWVNEALGISEPVSTADQAARLAGAFFPIPGGAAAAGAGRLARVLRGMAYLSTPMVKRGPGFAMRAGIQAGLGTGIEQGVRAYQGRPLIFSKEALTGEQPLPVPAQIPQDPSIVVPAEDQELRSTIDEAARTQVLRPLAKPTEEFILTPTLEISSDIVDGTSEGLDELVELDRRLARDQEWEDTKFWIMVLAAALAGGAAIKWARSGKTIGKDVPLVSDTVDVNKYVGGSPNILTKHPEAGSIFDKAQAIKDGLNKVGVTDAVKRSSVEDAHLDAFAISASWEDTAKFGQGYIMPSNMKAWRTIELEADEIALGPERAKLFNEAMFLQSKRATMQNAEAAIKGEESILWKAWQKQVKGADKKITAARADKDIKALMDKHAQNYEVILDYAKYMGAETQETIARMVGRATLKDASSKRIAYMPLYSNNKIGFLKRMSTKYLRFNTKQGRVSSVPEEFRARGINIRDADDYISPLNAMRRYSRSVISHSITENFKGGVLDDLAGVVRTASPGGIHARVRFGAPIRRPGEKAGEFSPRGRDVEYIGKGDNFDDIDNIHIEVETSPGFNVKSRFESSSINDLRAKWGDNAIKTAHIEGELRVYHVPDRGIQAAVELNPRLSPGLQWFSNWKNLFMKFTTGEYSVFAPFSGLYSMQQTAVNVAAREGVWGGAKTIGQSFSGVGKLMVESGSGDIAKYLTRRIAKQVGEGSIPSARLLKMENTLSRRFLDSVMNQHRTETGGTVTGLGNVGSGTMDEMMDVFGPAYAKQYSSEGLGLLRELWRTWNHAWHEGPAHAVVLRKLGEAAKAGRNIDDPKLIREISDYAKTVSADMRRIGSSRYAEVFNATVPFSSAMLQSWSSIGGAIKSNPARFIGGISALIGIPTMTELASNALISESSEPWEDANGKMWSYNDYYWNGFTTKQRVDNFIYFLPGTPPWDAVLVPISPEWSLFRGVVMEAADAIFGLSDQGAIGLVDQAKVNRSMFIGSFARVFDIPLPPLGAAVASGLGLDLRLGLSVEVKDDPDNPGLGATFLRSQYRGGGERYTRRTSRDHFDNEFDRNVADIIQDIFGAAGSMYINVHTAYTAGEEGREGTITRGLGMGLAAVGQTLKQQSRYLQPLLGKALRPNASDEVSQFLHGSRKNLIRLSEDMRNGFVGAGVVWADGQAVKGNLRISDDPIHLELAADASGLNSDIGMLDKEIASLKRDLSTIRNAPNLGSLREVNDKLDAITLQIQMLKAHQLSVIHDYEDKMSLYLSKKYKRDINIDLSSYTPRRAEVKGGSTLQELLMKPQTSQ